VREYLFNLLKEKWYDEFKREHNIIYNSEGISISLFSDLNKINKLLLSQNANKVHKIYKIVKLVTYKEKSNKREVVNIKSSVKKNLNKEKLSNEIISYKIKKKRKSDTNEDDIDINNDFKNKKNSSPCSLLNNIENNFNKNVEKEIAYCRDELKSISTQSTKNQTYSFSNHLINNTNIKNQISSKDFLLNSAKLFHLTDKDDKNINSGYFYN